ncbi:MAG TPA: IPT/TIG domain-containing protein [Cyclobacteriaceae bacterium]|nr:IPT/TIG domain-containing protein [Cyclobacteriaceae bacterium]
MLVKSSAAPILIALMLSSASLAIAQTNFTKVPLTINGVQPNLSAVDFLDFNNDGRTDIFAVNGNVVNFFVNSGAATPVFTKHAYQITTTTLQWAKPLDYNFDGLTDVAIYNGTLTIYITEFQLGNYINTPLVISTVNPGSGSPTVFQDINNDTHMDIIVLNGSTLRIYGNNGRDVFKEIYTYAFGYELTDYLTDLMVVNYNNDRYYDVVIGPYIFTNYGNDVFAFTNNFYRPDGYLTSGFRSMTNAMTRDSNFDGKVDMIINYSILNSGGNGGEEPPPGDEDCYYAWVNGNTIVTYEAKAEGIFEPALLDETWECGVSNTSKIIAVNDFNNDGQPEVLGAWTKSQAEGGPLITTGILTHRGTNVGLTAAINVPDFLLTQYFTVDINKDSRTDIAFLFGTKLYFVLNNMGTVLAPMPTPTSLASSLTSNRVDLSWASNACTECTYEIYLRKGIDTVYHTDGNLVQMEKGTNHLSTDLAGAKQWMFSNLENGTYSWSVRANRQGRKFSTWATEDHFTINTPDNGNELSYNDIVNFGATMSPDQSVWLAMQRPNGSIFAKYAYDEAASSFVKISQDPLRLNAQKPNVFTFESSDIVLKTFIRNDSVVLVKDNKTVARRLFANPDAGSVNYTIARNPVSGEFMLVIAYFEILDDWYLTGKLSFDYIRYSPTFAQVSATTQVINADYQSDPNSSFSLRFTRNPNTNTQYLLINDIGKSLYFNELLSAPNATPGVFGYGFDQNWQLVAAMAGNLDGGTGSMAENGLLESYLEFDTYNNRAVYLNRAVIGVPAGVYGYTYPAYEVNIGASALGGFDQTGVGNELTAITTSSNPVPNSGARFPYLVRLSKRNEYAAFWLNNDNKVLFYTYLDPINLKWQLQEVQVVQKIQSEQYSIITNTQGTSVLLGWIEDDQFLLRKLNMFHNDLPVLESMSVVKSGNNYRAYAGDVVTIKGKNFGKTSQTNKVRFGGIEATVVARQTAGDEISVVVPQGLTREPVPVEVTFDDQVGTSSFLFENLTLPVVTSIDKTVGELGEEVTIKGDRFSTDLNQMSVRFGAVAASQSEFVNVTTTQIKVKVPQSAARGTNQTVSVVIQDQVVAAPEVFRVIVPPVIESIEAADGFVSCNNATIRGRNFSDKASDLVVKFGSIVVPSTDIVATKTALIVKIPFGAQGDLKVTVAIDDRVSTSETIKPSLGSSIVAGSNQHPQYMNLTARNDDQVELRVRVLNQCSVNEVRIWKKGISQPDAQWKKTVLTTLDANRIDHTVTESEMTDPIGLACYYEIVDKSTLSVKSEVFNIYKQYAELDSTNVIPNLAFGGDADDYNLISIPYEMDPNNIPSVFSDIFNTYGYDSSKWRLYHYANNGVTAPRYTEYLRGLEEINPGKGYWIIVRNSQEIFLKKGKAVNLENGPFKITLYPGWNQIGNPYDFDVSWANVLSFNSQPANLEPLKGFSHGTFGPITTLKRFGGGFVRYNGTTPLTIQIPFTNSSGSGRIAAPEAFGDIGNWRLPLVLSAGTVANSMPAIGMHPRALPDDDPLDEHNLPLPAGFMDISFPHGLSSSITTSSDNHKWTFNVKSTAAAKTITISWDTSPWSDTGHMLFLHDISEAKLIDMRSLNSYTFANRPNAEFDIYFGDKTFIEKNATPHVPTLGDSWPNPMSSVARIPYTIAEESSHAQLQLYTLQGQPVRTLLSGMHPKGFYEAEWDGTDDQGQRISAGVVLYRLQVVFQDKVFTATKKIVIR